MSMTLIEFHSKSYYDVEKNVIRWVSNGNIPFDDLLEEMGVSDTVRFNCGRVRDKETREFIATFKERERLFWTDPAFEDARAERMAEMSAAFGEGVDVVNVITGKRHRT